MIQLLLIVLLQTVPAQGGQESGGGAPQSGETAASAEDHHDSDSPASQNIVVTGEKIDEDKMVCRKEKVIGSNIPKRVCRSAAQIAAEAEAATAYAHDATKDQQRRQAAALNSYQ